MENEAVERKYVSVAPTHPETVVRWFLDLKHHWFDGTLGDNLFTGQYDDARRYLQSWIDTGELAPSHTTLEISIEGKFEEWLWSSWKPHTRAPASPLTPEQAKERARKIARRISEIRTAQIGFDAEDEWFDKCSDIIVTELVAPVEIERPKIICLCGSTRFIETFAIKTWELEREGNIVLGCTLLPMWYCNVQDHFGEAAGTKEQCDDLHKRKMDLADEVIVLNVSGYVGESTRSEIEYAIAHNKPVSYLEPLGVNHG